MGGVDLVNNTLCKMIATAIFLIMLLGASETRGDGLKSWEIQNGVLPDDLKQLLKDKATKQTIVGESGLAYPPWKMYPELKQGSMGWRMGAGEDYMLGFTRWFGKLDADKKEEYISMYPEPESWVGFYGRISSLF
jgi:hypothetical protein